jgi:acyl-coenzyme A thioesterase PaaI-like protein
MKKKKNYCFACGPDNPHGLRLKFQYDPQKREARCSVKIPARYQGATGYAHGGMIATLLDEAMAKANGLAGIRAVTLKLEVSYRKMVPVNQTLHLIGKRRIQKGRKLYLRSALQDRSGNLLAFARGLFLAVQQNPSV